MQANTKSTSKPKDTSKLLQKSSKGEQVEWDLKGIKVVVTRKKVKNINLRIKAADGTVSVSAPLWVSDDKVKAFVESKYSWIHAKLYSCTYVAHPLYTEPTASQIKAWRNQVEEETPCLIDLWEQVMEVKSQRIVYRNMTSRWGSCNPRTGRICINVRLAAYPHECLEYVVVHELCHLLEKGHGTRFKNLMDEFMPDWKKRRAQLSMPPKS